MAVEVILRDDVPNLGKIGEVVRVKPGLRAQLPAAARSRHRGQQQEPARARAPEARDRRQGGARSQDGRGRRPSRSRDSSCTCRRARARRAGCSARSRTSTSSGCWRRKGVDGRPSAHPARRAHQAARHVSRGRADRSRRPGDHAGDRRGGRAGVRAEPTRRRPGGGASRQALEAREAAGTRAVCDARAAPRAAGVIPSRSTRSGWCSSATATGSSTRRAFRRLEYKTQVFVNHEGDYYRTRLTHTMEAAQVTRTLARALGLNEDLAEAVALAHDLGPHAVRPRRRAHARSPDAAARRLRAQRAEPAHRRDARGALSALPRAEPLVGGARGHRQALDALRSARRSPSSTPASRPCLEAQIVDFADEIAYTRTTSTTASSRACSIRTTCATVPLWADALARRRRGRAGGASAAVLRYQAVRRLIDWMASDLVETLLARIARRAHRQPGGGARGEAAAGGVLRRHDGRGSAS